MRARLHVYVPECQTSTMLAYITLCELTPYRRAQSATAQRRMLPSIVPASSQIPGPQDPAEP